MANNSTPSTPAQSQAALQELLNGPAGNPPTGIKPNLGAPTNLMTAFIVIFVCCQTFATLAVFVRCFTKHVLRQGVVKEDWLIVLAWAFQIGYTVPGVFAMRNGGGVHMWDLQLKRYLQMLYWADLVAIMYNIVVCLVKGAILLQYLRIFVPKLTGNMILYVLIQVLGWSIFAFYLANTIVEIAICIPRKKLWNPFIKGGHCININASYNATSVMNIFSDVMILILPIVPIWKLQMPRRKKVLTTLFFAVGIIACVTSVLRTYYVSKVQRSTDISYNLVLQGLVSLVEMTAGILISCMPLVPNFCRHISSKLSHITGSTAVNRPSMSVSRKQLSKDDHAGSGTLETEVNSQTVHDGEHISLDDFDLGGPIHYPKEWPHSELDDGCATRRQDIEAGLPPA